MALQHLVPLISNKYHCLTDKAIFTSQGIDVYFSKVHMVDEHLLQLHQFKRLSQKSC